MRNAEYFRPNNMVIILVFRSCYNTTRLVQDTTSQDMTFRRTAIFTYAMYWSVIAYAVKPLQYLKADPTSKGAAILHGNTACEVECHASAKQYFCASNGRTLDSVCRVQQARCLDPYLNVTTGKCQNSVRCRKERNHSLMVQRFQNSGQMMNVPSCKKDGSYTPIQCNTFFGYCWCVTSVGRMVKDSTFAIGAIPACGQSREGRKRRCSTEANKATFAVSLRKLIQNEALRRHSANPDNAIKMKFHDMDANGDGSLSSREMRRLLKVYRRKLTRSCMKMFWKFCDFDQNRLVSLAEFGLCLGAIRNMRDWESSATGITTTIRPRTEGVRLSMRISHTGMSSSNRNRTRQTRQGTSPSFTLETCRYMRQELLKSHKKNVDIPDCEGPDDQFWLQVQCHASYCYCVDRETGVPVPATAVRSSEGVPNCQKVDASLYVPRPIAGCPSRLKDKFLGSVQKALIQEMTKNRITEAEESAPLKERAARWYFSYLDQNRDNALGRKECKALKKFLLKSRVSKRCLRKFTHHCDRNKDSKISVEEFVGCLEVRRPERRKQYPDLRETIDRLISTDDPDNS